MFEGLNSVDLLVALSILSATIALLWVFHLFLRRLAQSTRSTLAETVLLKANKPAMAFILFIGLYFSATSLPWSPSLRSYLATGLIILLNLVGIYALTIVLIAMIGWYEQRLTARKEMGLASRALPWFRALVLFLAGSGALVVPQLWKRSDLW